MGIFSVYVAFDTQCIIQQARRQRLHQSCTEPFYRFCPNFCSSSGHIEWQGARQKQSARGLSDMLFTISSVQPSQKMCCNFHDSCYPQVSSMAFTCSTYLCETQGSGTVPGQPARDFPTYHPLV